METTGSLFEVSGGWAAQTRWQQAGGHGFPVNKQLSPEDVITKWKNIINFGEFPLSISSILGVSHVFADDGRVTYPTSTQQGMERVCHISRERRSSY